MDAFLQQAHAVVGGHARHEPPLRQPAGRRRRRVHGQRRTPWAALVDDVRALHDQVLAGGGPHYVERHRSRGKMMVRERMEALVDPGTPVLELCPLAGLETGDPLGGGVVVALGEVAHTQCLVIANDPTVRGGTTSPTTIKKLLRAMDVAETNRLPLVLLVESGGADLPRQADVFVPGGEQFRRLTQLSAQGIPTICVVFGSSTAGGAYLPGMSDYTVMVEGRARVFLGGPPLVKMAIGEEADEEELGGARSCTPARRACATTWPGTSTTPFAWPAGSWPTCTGRGSVPGPAGPAEPPLYPAEELLGVAPVDVRVPFDVREILARVARRLALRGVQDALRTRSWSAAGPPSAATPSACWPTTASSSPRRRRRAPSSSQLCNRSDTPLLFVQNITGFMVGPATSRAGSSRTAPS